MTGKELKSWRQAMGYKHQTDAADALGVPYRTYQRWERAKELGRVVELATMALRVQAQWPGALDPLRAIGSLLKGH